MSLHYALIGSELSPPEVGLLNDELFVLQQQRQPFPNPESERELNLHMTHIDREVAMKKLMMLSMSF